MKPCQKLLLLHAYSADDQQKILFSNNLLNFYSVDFNEQKYIGVLLEDGKIKDLLI